MSDAVLNWLVNIFKDIKIVTTVIAFLPLFEARLAIPLAISYGLKPLEAFLFSLIGSTAAAVILPLFLLALLKAMSKIPLLGKLSQAVIDRAEKASVSGKKMLGVMGFVALPLPMTGVWTGSVLAGILGLNYIKSFFSLFLGNLAACLIILITSVWLGEYINVIVWVLFAAAFASVVILLAKTLLKRPKQRPK